MTIPLWPALVAGFGIISSIVGVVVWVFTTFERKVDAVARHDSLEDRVSSQEHLLQEVAQNVSYIRGRLEPK